MRGIMLMAYGSPKDEGDVARYYRDVMGGREPTAPASRSRSSRRGTGR